MKITRVLGTAELHKYLRRYEIRLQSQFDGALGRFAKRPWATFVTQGNQHYVTQEALDFLDSLLKFDHKERIWSPEAKHHPYFDILSPEERGDQNDDVPYPMREKFKAQQQNLRYKAQQAREAHAYQARGSPVEQRKDETIQKEDPPPKYQPVADTGSPAPDAKTSPEKPPQPEKKEDEPAGPTEL